MIVEIDSKALKDLSKIQKQEVKKILSKIELLEEYPAVANMKKLTNFEPPYRLKVATSICNKK
jgi:mRNA interferase RelE/StbE